MPIQLKEENGGKILVIHVTGSLAKADYEGLVAEFARLVKKYGKLRVLFGMTGFHGWDAGAAWEDFKFDLKHFSDIDRLAMVGDRKWEQDTAIFFAPFTEATTRYVDIADRVAAQRWLNESLYVKQIAPST